MTIVYITKYAITTGVYSAEADVKGDMAVQRVQRAKGSGYAQYFHGKDWHLTEDEALDRAEEMRIAKLKSLDKQMKKISALKFTIKSSP